jgi:Na+-translocating ferredoxin:NAD+ oxidoreductase RnfC subunit
MHIGAPSEPVVKAGDKVTEGSMIAKPAKGLSVAIHAPISGTVKLVGKDIYIES